MLAYIFWHVPAPDVAADAHERAQLAFQRSLARRPPFGFRGSAVFRIDAVPWSSREGVLAEPSRAGASAPGGPAYEDWYLIEDFAALGVLNEAAVGRGHRSSHERAARGFGGGTAALYRLLEGAICKAEQIAACSQATWVRGAGRGGAGSDELGALLGDGLDEVGSSLWQRQLVLGPAPEFCLLSREPPPGAAPTRLAEQWSAVTLHHERVW